MRSMTGRAAVWRRTAEGAATLTCEIATRDTPAPAAGAAVVKVLAAGVNQSDAKMAGGWFPFVKPPIVSGRDFSGVVVAGPAALVGTEVFGTGGAGGFLRDGSHAQYLEVPDAALLTPKPANLSHEEAGTLGVPYFTAYDCLRKAAPAPGEIVAVNGATGMFGRAALALAKHMWGATTVAVVRRDTPLPDNADYVVNTAAVLDDPAGYAAAFADAVGRAPDVFLDGVGGVHTSRAIEALAPNGRYVVIATPTPAATAEFNVLSLYRRNLQLLGANSIGGRDADAAAALAAMVPHFEAGRLPPLPLDPTHVPLEDIEDAFARVLAGARERVVIKPWAGADTA